LVTSRRELGSGLDADPDEREIALEHTTGAGAHASHRTVSLEGSDPVPEDQLDAVAGMYVAVEGADLRPEDSLVGQRKRVDERDLEAALAR